jgi:ferredoxin
LLRPETVELEEQVKSREEIMEILEAFDLTRSFRDAGELAGRSHHTVAACATPGSCRARGRCVGCGCCIRSCSRSRSGSSGPAARSTPMSVTTSRSRSASTALIARSGARVAEAKKAYRAGRVITTSLNHGRVATVARDEHT